MKVVEAEVAKRLAAEREKDEEERRAREEAERNAKEHEAQQAQQPSSPTKKGSSSSSALPSGVLTPLLKKHKDLDDELRARLQELERRLYVFLFVFKPTPPCQPNRLVLLMHSFTNSLILLCLLWIAGSKDKRRRRLRLRVYFRPFPRRKLVERTSRSPEPIPKSQSYLDGPTCLTID
jgi:hypothetical protein